MTNREKYGYWEENSRYDLDTASAMFETGRYLYSAFMCQQTIEKMVKGLHVLFVGEEPQKTHNIALLFTQLTETEEFRTCRTQPGFEDSTNRYIPFFVRLLAFYISSRYPSYKERVATLLDRSEAEDILLTTKEAHEWLTSLSKSLT
jgi:HEPN domain-containing protein